jgi:hypothetical protein
METINKISKDQIEVVNTETIEKRVQYIKSDLESRKEKLLTELQEIETLLSNFTE